MMRCRSFTVCVFLVVMLALNGCATLTAVPTSTVPSTTAPSAAPATAAPTAIPATTVSTAIPSTAAPSATRTSAPLTPAPTATPQPTQAAQSKSTPSSSGIAKLDLNVLLPAGEGRSLVIENCMACHSIAPVLVSQKTAGEWQGTMVNHRSNMGGVNDVDYQKMTDYLAKFFGPDHKIPDLPPELLSGWTNY